MLIIIIIHAYVRIGVTVGLELTSYNVNEGAGSIEVCAVLVSGSLQRILTINLSTQQNANAQGKSV